jgi:hypothetical protein
MPNKANQTPDQPNAGGNMGVGGDPKPINEVYPRGEDQHDDINHYTGIGDDNFARNTKLPIK